MTFGTILCIHMDPPMKFSWVCVVARILSGQMENGEWKKISLLGWVREENCCHVTIPTLLIFPNQSY